jgi:hypothetical protein
MEAYLAATTLENIGGLHVPRNQRHDLHVLLSEQFDAQRECADVTLGRRDAERRPQRLRDLVRVLRHLVGIEAPCHARHGGDHVRGARDDGRQVLAIEAVRPVTKVSEDQQDDDGDHRERRPAGLSRSGTRFRDHLDPPRDSRVAAVTSSIPGFEETVEALFVP